MRIKACPKPNWITKKKNNEIGKKKKKNNNSTTSIQYPIVPLIEKERVLASMDGNLISLISNFRSTSMNEKEKKTCRKVVYSESAGA